MDRFTICVRELPAVPPGSNGVPTTVLVGLPTGADPSAYNVRLLVDGGHPSGGDPVQVDCSVGPLEWVPVGGAEGISQESADALAQGCGPRLAMTSVSNYGPSALRDVVIDCLLEEVPEP